jgi:hypothetical protein
MRNPSRTASPARSWRDRSGFCGVDVLDQPSGVLDSVQRATLSVVAERCKIAHDLLAEFADRFEAFPAQLVTPRTQELAAVRLLLDRYGMADPTAGRDIGTFRDAATQAEYDRLLAYGGGSRAAALDVTTRLARGTAFLLERALPALTARDVRHTYVHLLVAAHQQVRITQAWGGR